MKFRIIAAATTGAMAALAVSPALAASAAGAAAPRTFGTTVSGTCDTATGEWIADWAITNQSDTGALLIVTGSTPSDHRINSLPSVAGGATEHALQRIPGDSAGAHLQYIAVWTDFPGGSYQSTTDFTAPQPCVAA
ncbi:hypothetical protein Asi03nite_57250 [Actinoplanes siamensis]|uniref:Secreted protein n=2 Tax=Actinoplanes siamensis TaxID=1223317 RepID=A0A919NBM8_9ACTN|nr:hypothetical protein Asi03nite_57250 [Actinoplanes siamensis]